MKRFTKLLTTKAQSIDERSKSVQFVISTNEEDRYGEVVDQKSWDFKRYLTNPVLLWGHNSDEPENVLGTASDLQTSTDGSQTLATLTFDTDINPKAGLVFDQIKRGTLRTVSVGFRNHTLEWDKDTPILKDNELFEISVVPIPANAGAIALGYKAGQQLEKDARWLMDGMRKEADLLDELLQQTDNKEKSMTPEQATAIIDGIADLKKTVEEQASTIAELKAASQTSVETDEENTAREAQEATDQKAADEEAARKAAEEEKNKTDPAKPGSDDQGGAGDGDTFDPDGEVTPEQMAEIDAALEAVEV